MGIPSARALALLGLYAGLSVALPARAAKDGLPAPAPQHRREQAAPLNQECEGCHVAIAREWRASYHRQAYLDPAFQRGLRRENVAFCRRCHAPESDPRITATGWPAENGVACVTCHVLDGQIASGNTGRAPGKPPPHPLLRDARLASEDACLLCHQFQFPDAKLRRVPELMQLTIAEHRASVYASTSCIDCHMPRVPNQAGGSHRSHAFLGGHDEVTVRGALKVEAARTGGTVTLHLRPQRVGHAFPTGDLFRRLVVTLSTDGVPALPIARRDLQRHYTTVAQLPGHPVRVTERDDRVSSPTDLAFMLPTEAAARSVRWRVTYQRVAFPIDQRGGPAELDGEVVVGTGSLSP